MHNVISLVGFLGSGKDTAGKHLVEAHGFIPFSFAGALKDALAAIFCWDRAMLEGDTPESRDWRNQVDVWWAERLGIPHFTPRWAMQNVGTNLFRQHLHQDIWINNIERKLLDLPRGSKIVLIDGRFPNELDLGRNKFDSTVIRVKRGPEPIRWDVAKAANGYIDNPKPVARRIAQLAARERMENEFKVHESEWAWVGYSVDQTIENDHDIQTLHERIAHFALAA